MTIARDTAFKVSIDDITGSELVRGESKWDQSYVVTPYDGNVSRVRVMGTVVSTFFGDDQKYGSITLDDGTDTISARAFREGVELMRDVKPGDIVDVVGKIKKYKEEKYISLESVERIEDPNWELVRRLELLSKRAKKPGKTVKKTKVREEKKPAGEPVREEVPEVEEEVVSENPKILVMHLIEELEGEDGVKYVKLQEESGLDDEALENVLGELMSDGEIYEPKIGRFKKV